MTSKTVNFGWMTTSPNPNRSSTGYDAGQRGWRLHAVPVERDEDYKTYKRRPALCGLWPRHGWGLDLFIEDECARCQQAMDRREAQGDTFVDLPALIAKEREAAQIESENEQQVSDILDDDAHPIGDALNQRARPFNVRKVIHGSTPSGIAGVSQRVPGTEQEGNGGAK